jgi:hypothetical protein
VEALPAVEDMFNDDALIVIGLLAIFPFAELDDLEDLSIGQTFVFLRVDTDMMKGLGGFGITSDSPHIMESFI